MDQESWPQLPAGYQLIGAYGVLLAVPVEWNPVMLRGHAGRGLGRWLGRDAAPRGIIALADLRVTRLEVRWRTLSSYAKAVSELEKVARKLGQSGLHVERREGAAFIHGATSCSASPEGRQVLVADGDRLYELHLAEAQKADTGAVVDWFLGANRHASRNDRTSYLWSFYGCRGWAPREGRVAKLVLQPGRVEVSLAYRGGKITLGSHGLADRLLGQGKTLLEWAKSRRQDGRAIGQWQVDGATVRYTGTELRKFCRRVHHELEFHHQLEQNRITWEHRQRWGTPAVAPQPAAEGITGTS